jgi:two-component system NtrC family sensor kinase
VGLFASYSMQESYHKKASTAIFRSLEDISAEISRRLRADQQLILKLPQAAAMQQFMPVLAEARFSRRHLDYPSKLSILSQFLQQYQSVISSFDTFRILDNRGNTLLKIRSGEESLTRYDSFEPYAIMDKEMMQTEILQILADLPNEMVSFIELPQTREEMGQDNNIVIPDGIIPLNDQGNRVGYLAFSLRGVNIDQVLELAPRLYNGELMLAEINDNNPVRQGQILYNDKTFLRFAHLKSTIEKLQSLDNGVIWQAYQDYPYGSIANTQKTHHAFYIEYFPYPNSLVSWLIINQIEDTALSNPFERIRKGLWVLASLAVLSSIFLAHFAARAISTPIMKLAINLKTFADGKPALTIQSNITELQESSQSFNYMAKKLEQAQQKRIQAENLLIQNAKLASLGQMAAGIGHEINNPLNNIRSLSRLISRDLIQINAELNHPTVDKVTSLKSTNAGHSAAFIKKFDIMLEDIQSLDEEVIRASTIVQGVLSFSRQIPDNEFKPFYLVDLLKNIDSLVTQEAKRAQVQLIGIDNIMHYANIMIVGDKGKLQQALINILLNAIQASATLPKPYNITPTQTEQKKVTLSLQLNNPLSSPTIILTIRDQGSGIGADIMDKIFDPFFTSKAIGQGTGLGLSISLGIIQNHQGQLLINNVQQGEGVLVQIILPVVTHKS